MITLKLEHSDAYVLQDGCRIDVKDLSDAVAYCNSGIFSNDKEKAYIFSDSCFVFYDYCGTARVTTKRSGELLEIVTQVLKLRELIVLEVYSSFTEDWVPILEMCERERVHLLVG